MFGRGGRRDTRAVAAADTRALIAAHRFGLGETSLAAVGRDPAGWLLGQVGPADAQRGAALASALDALRAQAELALARRQAAASAADARLEAAERLRESIGADTRARLVTAATTGRPFAERLALFWANHFTVSTAKGAVRGLAGPFEREAIRPHIGGRFETLLNAAVTHAAMLRYLDNDQSAGPDSRVVRRLAQRAPAGEPQRITGLNENLAREVLELHTLGAAGGGAAYGGWGGYTQADVTAFAAVLTGWRAVPPRRLTAESTVAVRFDPAFHQPGPKTVLGRRYAEGPEALPALLRELAQHPATARFIATKLARHFVADGPPPALVDRLRARFEASGGDLAAVYRTLVESPEAWAPGWPKLKTPEEFVVSSARLLGLGASAFQRVPDGGIGTLGQRVQSAPSPAGWPDRAEEWLGPDALWKRVEWATRVAERVNRGADARAIAESAFGDGGLGATSLRQIERAADGPQALALLLLAPEFQRR
jgi:uncharacterized protein (DUF1800 family)